MNATDRGAQKASRQLCLRRHDAAASRVVVQMDKKTRSEPSCPSAIAWQSSSRFWSALLARKPRDPNAPKPTLSLDKSSLRDALAKVREVERELASDPKALEVFQWGKWSEWRASIRLSTGVQ